MWVDTTFESEFGLAAAPSTPVITPPEYTRWSHRQTSSADIDTAASSSGGLRPRSAKSVSLNVMRQQPYHLDGDGSPPAHQHAFTATEFFRYVTGFS